MGLSQRRLQQMAGEFRERLSAATDFTELGEQAIELAREKVGISGANVFPIRGGGTELSPVTFCERYSAADAAQRTVDFAPIAEADTGAFEHSRREPGKLLYLNERRGRRALAGTTTFNELWRPLGLEEQLFGFVRGLDGGPTAFVCLTRTVKDRRFSETEQEVGQLLHTEVEKALCRLQLEGKVAAYPCDASGALAALRCAVPVACGLFDAEGRVLWLADAALSFLDLGAIHFEGFSYVTRGSPRLSAWRELARRCGRGAPPDQRLELLAGASARPVELSAGRRGVFVTAGGAVAAEAQPEPWSQVLPRLGLSPRESQVAWLLSQGHQVVNAAHILGISEQTVRVHVKHAYRKLRVSSRVELALTVRDLLARRR